MSKITLQYINSINVPTPASGYATMFFDAADSGIPKLKYSSGDVLTFSDISITTEWQNSVISVTNDPSPLSPNANDRFLIASGAIFDWIGRDGQIAEWSGSEWLYIEPTDGMTIKVDNIDGSLLHHEGSYGGTYAWITQNFIGKHVEDASLVLATPYVITHSLGDKDVIVQVYEGDILINDDVTIQLIDTNSVEVTSSTSRNVRVIVRT